MKNVDHFLEKEDEWSVQFLFCKSGYETDRFQDVPRTILHKNEKEIEKRREQKNYGVGVRDKKEIELELA